MKFKTILFIYLSIFLISCSVKKKVDGKYRSNFADLGFFITEIELKSDSTFHYKSSGDLQHIELEGYYKVNKNKLYLLFGKSKKELENEAIKIVGSDTLINF